MLLGIRVNRRTATFDTRLAQFLLIPLGAGGQVVETRRLDTLHKRPDLLIAVERSARVVLIALQHGVLDILADNRVLLEAKARRQLLHLGVELLAVRLLQARARVCVWRGGG